MPFSTRLPVAHVHRIVAMLFVAIILWLPRGFGLDHFVAVDERSWLTRSANFYLALTQGDFAHTFQRYHPGVTTMWLGAAGFLWRYPDYAASASAASATLPSPSDIDGENGEGEEAAVDGQISDMSEGVEGFLRGQGRDPLDLLAAGRFFVVLAEVVGLLIAFWLAINLFGLWPALAGFLLIAFEPFVLGLTRMLHVDGLSSVWMFVAVLAVIHAQQAPSSGRRIRDLILSGVAAGLAWLTKSPALFLLPLVGLLLLWEAVSVWRGGKPLSAALVQALVSGLVWLLVGAGIFVLLWPAMWVAPLESIRAILAAAGESAAEGHSKALFFAGKTYTGDPGPLFYPLTYLWRTTPVTLMGLVLAAVAGLVGLPPLDRPLTRQAALRLLVYVLLFTLFMTLGSKKFPRYLLPVYFPLTLLAGLGWVALVDGLADWLSAQNATRGRFWLMPILLALPVLVQAGMALPHFPYYFTYYNPWLGGGQRAPQEMMIGLGEGLDEAARYLATKENAEDLTVASWYRGGSFNYIFPYHTVDIDEFFLADYAVLYAHQWQREVPDKRLLDYFAGLTPEKTVRLHGVEYAQIYDLHAAPPPAYFTDWAGAIRLVRQDVPTTPVLPGDDGGLRFVIRLHFYSLAPLDRNLNVVVRVLDSDGQEVGRSEGWPFGTPTKTWEPGRVYVDGHEFTLPADAQPGYYRVQVGFYDPETTLLVTPTVAGTETPLADLPVVAAVSVGPLPEGPTTPLSSAYQLGDEVQLLGADVGGNSASLGTSLAVAPGQSVPLTLFWQTETYVPVDYTVLLHLVDDAGAPLVQWDGQPDLAATLWPAETPIVDEHMLVLPADLAPGEYRLLAGLYDLATLERLPVSRAGKPVGDTVPVATLVVKP